MKRSRWAIGILPCMILAAACTEHQKITTQSGVDATRTPTMSTRNVATLISDSGIIQYKIVSPLWEVYEDVPNPYWSFPEGIYLRQFDANFMVVTTVAADSATYLTDKHLWRLEGNVEVSKVPDELFFSPRLFWSQHENRIYSDTFIHIENSTHVLEGIGFESNDRFTQYRILKPQGIFPADIEGGQAPPPSTQGTEHEDDVTDPGQPSPEVGKTSQNQQ